MIPAVVASTCGCQRFIITNAKIEETSVIATNNASIGPVATSTRRSPAPCACASAIGAAAAATLPNITIETRPVSLPAQPRRSSHRICPVKNAAPSSVSASPRPRRNAAKSNRPRIAQPAITIATHKIVSSGGRVRSRATTTSGTSTAANCVRNADVLAAVCISPSPCARMPKPPKMPRPMPCRHSLAVSRAHPRGCASQSSAVASAKPAHLVRAE